MVFSREAFIAHIFKSSEQENSVLQSQLQNNLCKGQELVFFRIQEYLYSSKLCWLSFFLRSCQLPLCLQIFGFSHEIVIIPFLLYPDYRLFRNSIQFNILSNFSYLSSGKNLTISAFLSRKILYKGLSVVCTPERSIWISSPV